MTWWLLGNVYSQIISSHVTAVKSPPQMKLYGSLLELRAISQALKHFYTSLAQKDPGYCRQLQRYCIDVKREKAALQ